MAAKAIDLILDYMEKADSAVVNFLRTASQQAEGHPLTPETLRPVAYALGRQQAILAYTSGHMHELGMDRIFLNAQTQSVAVFKQTVADHLKSRGIQLADIQKDIDESQERCRVELDAAIAGLGKEKSGLVQLGGRFRQPSSTPRTL
jgi:hypothetical protein